MFNFKLIGKISEKVLLLIVHAYGAGKNGHGEALSFLTTISAIIYILSATLGSASYKDLLTLTSPIIEPIMLFILVSFVIIFSVCLLSYLDEILDFMPKEASTREEEKLLLFRGNEDIFVCLIFYVPSFVIMLHNFINGISIVPDTNSETGKVSMFLLAAGSFVMAISLVQKLFYYENTPTFLINLILTFCVGAISTTIYRDNQKSSLINDSRYCYWIKNHLTSEEVSSKDKRTCDSISEKGIDFRYIEISNYK